MELCWVEIGPVAEAKRFEYDLMIGLRGQETAFIGNQRIAQTCCCCAKDKNYLSLFIAIAAAKNFYLLLLCY
jgi:hypothetical protein